jgi:predicted dehydrogenase
MRDGNPVVAVVGLGYWGPNLARVLYEVPDVELGYLCDLDRGRLDRFERRYPGAIATTDLDQVLSDPEVDAVCFATPVSTHHGLASRALAAGKHTFVEKPLAPSRAEAEDLVALAHEQERALVCGHTFLYSPPVRAVKRLIDAGDLGDIFFVSSSRVNLGLHQRDVSVIWDLAPHDFSILLYWLGEVPATVSAVGRDSVVEGVPDVAFVNLIYPSGLIANVELSWLAPSKLRRTTVVGNKKMVVYDDTSTEQLRVFDHGVIYEDPETFGEYQLSYRTGDVVSPKLDASEPLAMELADFVAMVRRGSADPSQLEIAANVVAMAEAAQRSLDSGGERVAIDAIAVPAR